MNQLEQYIYDLNTENKKQKEAENKYKNVKADLERKIKNLLDKKKTNTYSFANGDENKYYRATVVQQKKIIFNPDVVEQIVDKKIFNQVCNKKYEITDYDGLAKYIKGLGGNPAIFKSFISCEKTIDNKKINQLSELGELSVDDLEGSYTVKPSAMWIKITESENEIEDEE